jgi:transcriptional regulator with XRE-family HTH domain
MLGKKLKELREIKGSPQRVIAACLEVDTAYISKIENEEKIISRPHLVKISEYFDYPIAELEKLWLCDKVLDLIAKEQYGVESLQLALKMSKGT